MTSTERSSENRSGVRVRRHKQRLATVAILTTLMIFILGCASLAAIVILIRDFSNIEVSRRKNIEALPMSLSRPDTAFRAANPVLTTEPSLVKNGSTAPHFLPPESVVSLEPNLTQVRETIDLPTPTPSPLPTMTRPPTPTDSPTPTPSPLPTATNVPLAALAPIASPSPQPEIRHVIIISIDGLRPDALYLANTPTFDNLIGRGAYSPGAQTVSLSITLPSHASMLSGMVPEKHGIVWGLPYIGWPGMNGPTLFNVAHDAGLSTAMVFGKEKMNYLTLPNSVDQLYGSDVHDPEIKDQVIELVQVGLPELLFIHFPDTDRVGHAYGWMSDNQLYAITFVDGLIREIIAELERRNYLDTTLFIISSDHGGHGFGHGDDSPEDRTIPWLAAGPGIRPGLTLSSHINTYDTAATAAYALELAIPENWDGQPIMEIFQEDEEKP